MSTNKKPVSEALYLEWVDASAGQGWTNPEELPEPLLMKTLGFIVKEDKHLITITQGVDIRQGAIMGFLIIPKGWIRKRKVIKV